MAGSGIFGLIRWDAWYDGTGTGLYARQAEHALSNPPYQGRAPWFATLVNANKLRINGATQAIVDQEIAYAYNAGVGFWCYCYYDGTGNVLGFNNAWLLHQSSARKNDMPWCWTTGITTFAAKAADGTFAAHFAQSNYKKVLGNRPLVFIQQSATLSSAPSYYTSALTTLKNACAAAGLGAPYIVIQGMGAYPPNVETTRVALSADAQGGYSAGTATTNGTYASLDTLTQTVVASWASASPKIVPLAMVGANQAARNARPAGFLTSYKPYIGVNNGYVAPTPSELVNHLAAIKSYMTNNASVCEAQVALVYSWNEHDEGGFCLCPTYSTSGPVTTYLDALKAAGSFT